MLLIFIVILAIIIPILFTTASHEHLLDLHISFEEFSFQ